MTRSLSISTDSEPSLTDQFDAFLANDQIRRQWLIAQEGKIYVRKFERYFENNVIDWIDIPNIEMAERGQGHFTRFLTHVENHPAVKLVYIENIIEPRLALFLKQRGYVERKVGYREIYQVCLYRKIRD